MAKFQTKIIRSKARFVVTGYKPEQMASLGQSLIDYAIKPRLARAEDIYDAPAPALKPNYAKFKQRRSPPAIRNWQLTGRLLRSMKVLRAAQNKAVIGFTDAATNLRAFLNNRRARQFGVSPKDRQILVQALRRLDSPISITKVA